MAYCEKVIDPGSYIFDKFLVMVANEVTLSSTGVIDKNGMNVYIDLNQL